MYCCYGTSEQFLPFDVNGINGSSFSLQSIISLGLQHCYPLEDLVQIWPSKPRETDISIPPIDLLDRIAIIRTIPYTPLEIVQVPVIHAQVEGLTIDEKSLAFLVEIPQPQ